MSMALVRPDYVATVATYDAEAHAAYLDAKRDLIRQLCLPKDFQRDDVLLDTVLEIGKLRGLNPLVKQMWVVPRGGKPSIETSIDGYRLIAARTGLYAGSDEPVFDVEGAEFPGRCTVTVHKIVYGEPRAFTATVRWSEFGKQGWEARYDNLWKTKPYHMLAIRAESHALKKAFPEETSGLSVDDGLIDHAVAPEREIRTGGTPVQIARPPSGGSTRSQLRASTQKAATPTQEPPIEAETREEPMGDWEGPATPQTMDDFWKRTRAAKIPVTAVWKEMEQLYAGAYQHAVQKYGKPSLDVLTNEDVHDLFVALTSNPEPADAAPVFSDEELAQTAQRSRDAQERAKQAALTGN